MILPKVYLDETCGVRPGPNQASFNNIVYTVWYMLARKKQHTINNNDLAALIKHIQENTDEYGLYKPKNSHDNITYKLIASKIFHLNSTTNMNFFKAIKEIGIYRIWDVIFYGTIFGPKLLRPVFRLFMFIPALQMIEACYSEGKIRPKWFGDGENSRIKWWFKKKKLIAEKHDELRSYYTWQVKNDKNRTSIHMQNDGKHLAVFRLCAFQDDFLVLKLAAKICKKILIKKYGHDYTYRIIYNYFLDRKHPLIAMWKGYGDIL